MLRRLVSSRFCAGSVLALLLIGSVQGFMRPRSPLSTHVLHADLSDLVTALGGIKSNQKSKEEASLGPSAAHMEPNQDFRHHSDCTFTPPPPLITTLPPLANDPIYFFGDGVARINKGKALLVSD